MHIWWGWRVAFDCTCLWAFLHYFSLCKFTHFAVIIEVIRQLDTCSLVLPSEPTSNLLAFLN